jgi:hypothetical protein
VTHFTPGPSDRAGDNDDGAFLKIDKKGDQGLVAGAGAL